MNLSSILISDLGEKIANGAVDDKMRTWNVILAGLKDSGDIEDDRKWKIPGTGLSVVKINRSSTVKDTSTVARIGVLVSPNDVIADADKKHIEEIRWKEIVGLTSTREKRKEAGLGDVPALIMYAIDKNSTPKRNTAKDSSSRFDLNAKDDIIGIALYVPGGRPGLRFGVRFDEEDLVK